MSEDFKTPIMEKHFKFPPDPKLLLSADHINDSVNYPCSFRSRRSFSPYRNSLCLPSPLLSPIEFLGNHSSVIRLPRNKIERAAADSTDSKENVESPVKKASAPFKNLVTPSRKLSPMPKSAWPFMGSHRRKSVSGLASPSPDALSLFKKPREPRLYKKSLDFNKRLSVSMILTGLGLSNIYIKNFEEEMIDLSTFLCLNDTDLKRLGVKNYYDRSIILRYINDTIN